MKDWIKVSLVLCTFGFFREMRPSEPFVTEFLSGEWRNVTADQVNREVYPLGTYSYLAQLIIIFLITDMLRYKPIIVASSLIGIVLWSLLLWTYSLTGLQFVQLCYGTFMAAEVAYYTYMYAKVDKDKYQQVTGHARAGILSGRFLASVIAQILISFDWMDFRELNYISFAAQIISFPIAIMLPSVGTSMYFYAPHTRKPTTIITKVNDYQSDTQIKTNLSTVNLTHESQKSLGNSNDSCDDTISQAPQFSCNRAINLLWSHFVAAYTNRIVLQWSIWWSLAMCGFLLVQSYVQLLWKHIDPESTTLFNGGVEAVLTLLGALSAVAAGFLDSERYHKWDLWVLTVCSLLEGIFLLIATFTTSVWVSYVMYIAFGVLYQFMITMASAVVAKNLLEDSFALIFGINTLLALVFQTIITVVAITESGLELDVKWQFIVFGCYFIILAVIYGVFGIISLVYGTPTKNTTEIRAVVNGHIRDEVGL